jgi:hypothetical protein
MFHPVRCGPIRPGKQAPGSILSLACGRTPSADVVRLVATRGFQMDVSDGLTGTIPPRRSLCGGMVPSPKSLSIDGLGHPSQAFRHSANSPPGQAARIGSTKTQSPHFPWWCIPMPDNAHRRPIPTGTCVWDPPGFPRRPSVEPRPRPKSPEQPNAHRCRQPRRSPGASAILKVNPGDLERRCSAMDAQK